MWCSVDVYMCIFIAAVFLRSSSPPPTPPPLQTWSRVSGLFAAGVRAAQSVSPLWGEQPALLVIGGLSSGDKVSDDAWIFNLGTYTWTKVGCKLIDFF